MSSPTSYLPITFQPGILRDVTEYAAENRWYSMDKVRFRQGFPQTIGGWQPFTGDTFLGIARNGKIWTKLTGEVYLGLGTHNHLYIWDKGTFSDITPIQSSASVNNNLNFTSGATSVVVSINSHNRSAGDYFIIDNTASIIAVNASISGEYLISSIIDTNTFAITTSVTAAATSAATGGAVQYRFPLPSGLQSNIESFGWGRSGYGSGGYGTSASAGVTQNLRLWSLSPFGEDLLSNPKGGGLYLWDATNGLTTRSVIVTAAPSIIDMSFVAPELRQVIALGTTDVSSGVYDPLLIRWSASENYNDWGVSAGNDGGFYRLDKGTEIRSFVQSRNETLIWTDAAIYSQKYVAGNDIYSFTKLGENVSPMGKESVVDIGGVVLWMGHRGFYKYDGQITQLNCTLQRDVFAYDGAFSVDHSQEQKAYCGLNTQYSEVIWLYQALDSTNNEINRYVLYNYNDDTWAYGTLGRTVWIDSGIFENPLATGDDGYLYYHELGLTAGNETLESYIESAPFDIGDGVNMLEINRIIPDFTLTGGAEITLTTRLMPNGEEFTKGPYAITSTTDKIDLFTRGRQGKIRIGTSAPNSFWRLGKVRLGIKENGRR